MVQGKLYKVLKEEIVTPTFKKRGFVIIDDEGQYLLFYLYQKHCEKILSFQEGEWIAVLFRIRGKEWISPKGEVKYITTLEAIDIQRATPSPPSATYQLEELENMDDLPF